MGGQKLRLANLIVAALCPGRAGAAQADEKSALIFVDVPESSAMLAEGNRLFFVRSDRTGSMAKISKSMAECGDVAVVS